MTSWTVPYTVRTSRGTTTHGTARVQADNASQAADRAVTYALMNDRNAEGGRGVVVEANARNARQNG